MHTETHTHILIHTHTHTDSGEARANTAASGTQDKIGGAGALLNSRPTSGSEKKEGLHQQHQGVKLAPVLDEQRQLKDLLEEEQQQQRQAGSAGPAAV